jgi:hypothetical protein
MEHIQPKNDMYTQNSEQYTTDLAHGEAKANIDIIRGSDTYQTIQLDGVDCRGSEIRGGHVVTS